MGPVHKGSLNRRGRCRSRAAVPPIPGRGKACLEMSVVDAGNGGGGGGGGGVVAGNKFCALSTCGATRKVR